MSWLWCHAPSKDHPLFFANAWKPPDFLTTQTMKFFPLLGMGEPQPTDYTKGVVKPLTREMPYVFLPHLSNQPHLVHAKQW